MRSCPAIKDEAGCGAECYGGHHEHVPCCNFELKKNSQPLAPSLNIPFATPPFPPARSSNTIGRQSTDLAKHGGGHQIATVLGGYQVGGLEKDRSPLLKRCGLPRRLCRLGRLDRRRNLAGTTPRVLAQRLPRQAWENDGQEENGAYIGWVVGSPAVSFFVAMCLPP